MGVDLTPARPTYLDTAENYFLLDLAARDAAQGANRIW